MNTNPAPKLKFFETLKSLLKSGKSPGLPQLAQDLYGLSSWEDLQLHAPESIATVVQNAWAHLSAPRDAAPSIKIYEPEWASKPTSIIEIISNNRPFIFDSVMGELSERGVHIRLVAHPVVSVARDESGKLTGYHGIEPKHDQNFKRESFIHIHIDPITSEDERKALIDALHLVLKDVRSAVEDWRTMMERVDALIHQLETTPPPLPQAEVTEAIAFLSWLRDHNFTFLGVREYVYEGSEKDGSLEPMNKTGLGLLRDSSVGILRRGKKPVTMTPEIRAFLNEPTLLIVSKGNLRSRVHRHAYMDYVGIKLFDSKGTLQGELRLTGLFTSTAYTRSVKTIPYIRRKVQYVQDRAGFDADSHSGKALLTVLENFPRDELFQLDDPTLYEFSMAVLELEERPRIRVLARRDEFERFVSVIVFIPRERVTTNIRIQIGELMAKAFGGRISAVTPSYPEGPLARLHYIVGKNTETVLQPERKELELQVAAIVQNWTERLAESIEQDAGEDIKLARSLQATWANAFDAAYQQDYSVETAKADIKTLEKLRGERAIALDFFHDTEEGGELSLKIFHKNAPIALSERVPMLENMGFRVIAERTYTLHPLYDGVTAAEAYLHDMSIVPNGEADLSDHNLYTRLEGLFMAVWNGRAENDGFNALSLLAGLEWREVALLRAIARYLRQVQTTYPLDYMAQTLVKHPAIARQIVALFMAKFDPLHSFDMESRVKSLETNQATLKRALSSVSSLDEDRILRRFINIIDATWRTNFFQNLESDTISFKINSAQVEGLPKPKPMAEIWVYSPRVEGVHLRFGRIARGGLRWSDRPQDFRTEVLGLVKAQQVKNAVIVPVGAKGGFVPKHLPANGTREEIFAEGTESYKLFISSLLAITDNRSPSGEIIPPANVVRHDGDDPYLVVAADKGTATFSDTANGISEAHNFWLGDAFASGGSVGYDHKKMGITARGGWEAVKRHFREMNTNIQTTPFTVAGVGDMSGDVFGNGMLLSRAIKLVAAFDHRDIFLDPTPDPETSFRERERMFALPRSSWTDYDKTLISKGGGVFSRALKSIPISKQVQETLGITASEMTPVELMNAILKAPVDLMWFGGIGTYIRATDETDAQVGDRATDAMRITAPELRAKVVGEGANLGLTQRARIEAAQHGVRLNTDAIDNSAGVNSSDVEVNIKIALEGVVRSGRLKMEKRNELLASMTEEVGHLVLANNYRQTLAVSIAEHEGVEDLAFAERLMLRLEAEGRLDRAVEFLPSSTEIARRAAANQGLTRPEIAVLLAYAKLSLKADLLTSPCLDDAAFERKLLSYFPSALQKSYKQDLLAHGLRREIVATKLVNLIIDRGGPTILPRVLDQTGSTPAHLAIAFALAWHVFDGETRVNEIDVQDNKIDGQQQLEAYAELQNFMRAQTLWFIRNERLDEALGDLIKTYTKGVDAIRAAQKSEPSLEELESAPELIRIQQRTNASFANILKAWDAVGEAFLLPELNAKAKSMVLENYYDTLAQARLLNDIARSQHQITRAILDAGNFAAWQASRQDAITRVHTAIEAELKSDRMTLSRLAVLNGFIADLAGV